MQRLELKKPNLSRSAFERRAEEYLQRIQADLMPDQANEIVAINMETGEYVVGKDKREVTRTFRSRWPNTLMFRSRVDGGPVTRFHGKTPA